MMLCPVCNEEFEYYGSVIVKTKDGVIKRNMGLCRKHIPYTPITQIGEEKMEGKYGREEKDN